MDYQTDPIHETKLSNKNGEFTSGFLSLNTDSQLVAYASLGKTTVSISRGSDGKVRVEIDDISDEDVYVSINSQPVTVNDDVENSEKPWCAQA